MDEQQKSNKKKKRGAGFYLRLILFCAALAVFAFSAYKLYGILHGYHAASSEYTELQDSFTSVPGEAELLTPEELAAAEKEILMPEESEPVVQPPFTVDFNELHAINPDIVAWIYVEAIPSINYPILLSDDNDYYLHRTFRREALFPGSIFEDYMNAADFSDPNTIVYGHNMKDGSMFGKLKQLRENPELWEESPYFWIFTPEGSSRYRIYAAFEDSATGEVYTLFSGGGKEYLEWMQKMQKRSEVKNDVLLREDDHTVILSTCTSNSAMRCVVLGKRVLTWPTKAFGTVTTTEETAE